MTLNDIIVDLLIQFTDERSTVSTIMECCTISNSLRQSLQTRYPPKLKGTPTYRITWKIDDIDVESEPWVEENEVDPNLGYLEDILKENRLNINDIDWRDGKSKDLSHFSRDCSIFLSVRFGSEEIREYYWGSDHQLHDITDVEYDFEWRDFDSDEAGDYWTNYDDY